MANASSIKSPPSDLPQTNPIRTKIFTYNGNNYDRIRVLGKGSFGTAVVHRRRLDYSLVVLKEIDLNRFKGESEYLSAINEARIMSTIDHPNIIKYYSAYLTEGKLIIEMEYASLGSLSAHLSSQPQALDECQVLVIFKQITAGLTYLHSKNIIHSDLKMANIFVTSDGRVKIGDFGIAQFLQSTGCTLNRPAPELTEEFCRAPNASSHLGTLAYSSPERCLGRPSDYKSDIWSLGCILYELLTGQPLFAARSLADLVLVIARIQYQPIKRHVTLDIKQMFEQTIMKDPIERPSAAQLLETTDKLLSRLQAIQNHRFPAGSKKARPQISRRLVERSTEFALLANENYNDHLNQVNYFHSIVYRVRLDQRPIRVDRVNLPQSKRIKEIVKGRSHYLVLTYDNIVYGWGSRQSGQLGACGLANHQQSRVLRPLSSRSARGSIDASLFQMTPESSSATSPASSSQTLAISSVQHSPSFSARRASYRRFVISALRESQPTHKPFVINELNHRKIVQVAAGNDFSVFLSKTGLVMTCGDGSTGCLGRGNWLSSFKPCMVESLLDSDVVCISCGPKHVVAVCGNGRAYSWGKASHGRLGIGRRTQAGSCQASSYILTPKEVDFPPNVLIKSVTCGDRCSVFIDVHNKTWACGQNTSNKLGLDVKRRFKKSQVTEESWSPVEIESLAKLKMLTCSIGEKHASYLTTDGKLIVLGQDIDYNYHLRQTNLGRQKGSTSIRPSSRLGTGSRHNVDCVAMHSNGLARLSKRHVESIINKSRASKRISLEYVVSTGCSTRFTLALTNDNKVYFWGTRTYSDVNKCKVAECCDKSRRSIEPQLIIGNNADEQCLVKIGTTNSSLMNDIEALGSDQPIIHAKDPRLIVRSLSDLWILDYQPTRLDSGASTCSASSCSGSSSCSSSSCCLMANSSTKHDAIIEPQPILSLYKPSMFNNRNCSLHLVEIFSFDEDCFYLVLDTSIRVQSNQSRLNMQPKLEANDLTSERATSFCGNRSPNALVQLAGSGLYQSTQIEQPFQETQVLSEERQELAEVPEDEASSKQPEQFELIENQNAESRAGQESNSGFSLDEPRSLSTFANSIGNHVVVAASLRSLDNQQQLLQHLEFDCDQTGLKPFELSGMNLINRRRRRRLATNKSESTTNTLNEHDETSSMPSWVRNEFIQHQQENHVQPAEGAADFPQSSSPESSDHDYERNSSDQSSSSKTTNTAELETPPAPRKHLPVLSTSKSQPDLNAVVPMRGGSRRASIKEGSAAQINTILDCNVYRASTNPYCNIYQSSSSINPNSQSELNFNRSSVILDKAPAQQRYPDKQVAWLVQSQPNCKLARSCDQLDLARKNDSIILTSSQPLCFQDVGSSTVRLSNLSISSMRKSLIRLFCS